jgi:hypothetical protein
MKHIFTIIELIIIGTIADLAISSCQLDSDPNEGKIIISEVVSDIDTLTFWNRATVYIVTKPDFKVNSDLVIQAGAVVKFDPSKGRSITVTKNGYITAQGSVANPVIFTSLYDDVHGKDSNHDNTATKPNAGDWDFIYFQSTRKSTFNLCNFYYGGGSNEHQTIKIADSSNLSITSCLFAYNEGGTLDNGLGVLDASVAGNSTVIQNNIFYGNQLPISINSNINLDSTNIFHNPQNSSETNKYNAILVRTTYPMVDTVEWEEDEVAYIIADLNFKISPTASLLLGNNVALKFIKNSTMILEGKNMTLRNNDGPGVVFTSIYDDTVKGDSNGDGGQTQPQQGDWVGIIVNDPLSFEWGNVYYSTQKHK